MTLETAVDRTQTTGNGVLDVFPYSFKVWDSSEIEVIRSNKIEPLEKQTLTITTDYTVQDVLEATGGTITLQGAHAASPPEASENITVLRKLAYTQVVGVENQGGFKGNMHENKFDWLTALIQQLKGAVDRCFQVDEVSMADTADLTYEDMLARSPTLIGELEAAGDASLDIIDSALEDYNTLKIELFNIRPATDGATLYLLISDDAGATWESSYDYTATGADSGGNAVQFDGAAAAQIELTDGSGNLAGEAVTGELTFYTLPNFAPRFSGFMQWCDASDVFHGVGFHARHTVAAISPIDGFRLICSAGNIAHGTIRIWGMPDGS